MSTVPHVYKAIAEITGELAKEGIAKDRRNQQQGYSFRGIDDVYASLSSKLFIHNLCILPRVVSRELTERVSAKGGVLFYTVLTVEFDFVSALDGSKHTVCMVGEAMDSGDKSTNKAMSAAYKYCCLQTFCIPTEGDNDADSTTHDVVSKQGSAQVQAEVLKQKLANVSPMSGPFPSGNSPVPPPDRESQSTIIPPEVIEIWNEMGTKKEDRASKISELFFDFSSKFGNDAAVTFHKTVLAKYKVKGAIDFDVRQSREVAYELWKRLTDKVPVDQDWQPKTA